MNTGELLSELRDNVLRDTTDAVVSGNADQLWDDASLVRYLNEAQVKFAVATLCFRDETTTAVSRVTLATGVDMYALDKRVVAVYGARIDRTHLSRTTYGGLFSNSGDVTMGGVRIDSSMGGQPRQFYTDRESGKLGVYPAPDAASAGQQLVLRVARRPLVALVASNLDAVPEVDEEFHLDLVEWAAYRALRNHDVDGENMAKANSHKKRFEDTIEEYKRKTKRTLAQDIQFDVRNNWGS
jgi:hypothetical protein